jgi:hypothetical protein
MSRNEGYIIEFYHVGNSVKVSAIDTKTTCEAVIIGSPHATREELKELAIRKLKYVVEKYLAEK